LSRNEELGEMAVQKAQKKSDITKRQIVEAARKLFGEFGFERTTVRQIAAEAGVDPALVVRYFGGKDQLFAVAAKVDLALPDVLSVDRNDIGITLARHYIRAWDGSEGLSILLRSAASNEAAAEHMREIFRTQVLATIRQVTPKRGASQRAALVSSQLLGVALCRYIIKLPPIVNMPAEKLASVIGDTIQRYIIGTVNL
jgi:AcrR family transcriptional regulator